MNLRYFTLLIALSFLATSYAQSTFDYGFERNDSIIVKDSLGTPLDLAWAGGLNSVHFQEMDLNLDGVNDLIVFDTHGDRLITFINDNIKDSSSYTYAPQYAEKIPKCYSWVITYDYNNDGKMDLFTSVPGGIRVFQNVSTHTHFMLKQETYMLKYLSSAGFYTNIYTSSVDFPSMADVDFDGDMDILTFYITGSIVVWYKNYSMELYGVPDSLKYKIADHCWGKFAEHEASNAVILDSYCDELAKSDSKADAKHVGSTILSLDLNGDNLMDMVLGDVDYFSVNGLYNGGTKDSAHIVSQDNSFPSSDQPIDIITFPVVNYIDIDNDNKKELIASPFDPSYYKTKTEDAIWMYDNQGSNSHPNFKNSSKSFFQDRMIDVGDASTPTLVDVDGDGLLDIVMGNYGNVDSSAMDIWYTLNVYKNSRLIYYKNIGQKNAPSYQFMDGNWLGMNSLAKKSFNPTFGDLDGDGDMDLLVGSDDGKLMYRENTAGAGQALQFDTIHFNYQNISVGGNSAPQLIDIDGDSLLDLVIGNAAGLLSYYRNTGTKTDPIFSLETDSMGNVHTINYWHPYEGYSTPHFFYDEQDSLKAFVGSASGFIFYYKDIRNNIFGTFGMDSNWLYTDIVDTLYSVMSITDEFDKFHAYTGSFNSAPLVYDFNNDGFIDIMTGLHAGGLNYFKGIPTEGIGIKETTIFETPELMIYPNPSQNYFNLVMEEHEQLQAIEIQIFDISGRLIKRHHFQPNNQLRINSSELKPGVYLVQVNVNNHRNQKASKTLRIVKL